MHTYMMSTLFWMPEDNSSYPALFYVLHLFQRESVIEPQVVWQPPRVNDHLSMLTEAQGS